ncbi:MAG: 30S ribosome-binding factor RbfA [Buchnera aphidicola (Schlechtendalia peitan)]
MLQANRLFRISKELQKEISWIICYALTDPRLKILMTVVKVKISCDLNYSKVYISILENDKNLSPKSIILILQKSSNYIRYLLAKRIRLRVIPVLQFIYDNSYIKGIKISNLINKCLNS